MDIDNTLLNRFSEDQNNQCIDLRVGINDDPRGDILLKFCEAISDIVPKIKIEIHKDENADLPYIQVIPNLKYHAVPDGKNLAAFLETLKFQNGGFSSLDESISEKVKGVTIPATIDIYIASQCLFCPTTVARMVPLAAINELVRMSIIDAKLFQEKTESAKVLSVPTIYLDGLMAWTGSSSLTEIVERMVDRDPAQLSSEALKGMLREGNAGRVAQLMLDTEIVFPAFIELLCDSKWSVRLGAMVAMETLATLNQRLAERAAALLWDRFSEVEDAVKGDILYTLGEAGTRNLLPEIRSVVYGDYKADVKEAAKEAVAALGG
jgi:hypothetical protein